MVIGTFRSCFCVATIMEAKETLVRAKLEHNAWSPSMFERVPTIDSFAMPLDFLQTWLRVKATEY